MQLVDTGVQRVSLAAKLVAVRVVERVAVRVASGIRAGSRTQLSRKALRGMAIYMGVGLDECLHSKMHNDRRYVGGEASASKGEYCENEFYFLKCPPLLIEQSAPLE